MIFIVLQEIRRIAETFKRIICVRFLSISYSKKDSFLIDIML